MEHVERNYNIVRDRMIHQMNVSLGYGEEILDSELNAGVLHFVIKPIVTAFYKYWTDKDAKVGTKEQIRLSLDSARSLILNGGYSEEKFNEIINMKFKAYLENDQTTSQCKKTHKNYSRLEAVSKQLFTSQVAESIILLDIKEDVNTYNELSRATYKTKENAYEALIKQLDLNESGIKIVEEDDSILKIAVGKNIITSTLRKGFDLTKQKLIEELDEIFL
ncbi:MAG: hypothetical protein KGD73_12780 [Candidatus Lokiarchaeota archaeon]|nr:hypothetical protein [Candidatus Lokiarchaeota archaeon]